MYGKVFASIFDGSLCGQFEATVTMMALIVLADRQGCVDMTPQALAARTGYPLAVIEVGLKALAQPDPRSRSKELEGRRIVPLDPERDWGWRLVNHAKYRGIRSADDRRDYMREYMSKRRKAADESVAVSTVVNTVNPPLADLANSRGRGNKQKRVEARATRFALDSAPDGWLDFCRRERPDLDPHETFARFGDYWRSKAGKDGRKLDWFATWRNWVRNERPAPARPPSPPQQVQGRDYV